MDFIKKLGGKLNMKTSFENIICPFCNQEHDTDYIPKSVGDYDEFYIKCENPNCREEFVVSVYIDKKEESHEGLQLCEYFKTNDVCIQTYRDIEDFDDE
jgi:hypothetical protein